MECVPETVTGSSNNLKLTNFEPRNSVLVMKELLTSTFIFGDLPFCLKGIPGQSSQIITNCSLKFLWFANTTKLAKIWGVVEQRDLLSFYSISIWNTSGMINHCLWQNCRKYHAHRLYGPSSIEFQVKSLVARYCIGEHRHTRVERERKRSPGNSSVILHEIFL